MAVRETADLLATVLLAAALLILPPSASAQPAASDSPPPSVDAVALQADSLLLSGDVAGTLAFLEARIREGDAYPLRWRAARAAVSLGILAQDPDSARPHLHEGIRHGEAAVELAPERLDGLYWRMAARGRLAVTHLGSVRGAELAQEVWNEALGLLERDPEHAGAHHALGRIHLEIERLPGWQRLVGRAVAGILGRTSWEEAEEHLRRAVDLDPGQILYRKDLGELFFETERPSAARIVLEQVTEMTPRYPVDPVFLEEARGLLRRLGEDGARR